MFMHIQLTVCSLLVLILNEWMILIYAIHEQLVSNYGILSTKQPGRTTHMKTLYANVNIDFGCNQLFGILDW